MKRPRFSLRSLLLFVGLCGITCALFVQSILRQERAIDIIKSAGGDVYYGASNDLVSPMITLDASDGFPEKPPSLFMSSAPQWLDSVVAVDLSGCNVSCDTLESLQAFGRLRKLHISHSGLSGSDLHGLAHLTNIEILSLLFTRIDDRSVALVRQFPRLRKLYLDGTLISDDGVAKIASCKCLTDLSLASTRISNRCLAELSRSRSLQKLCMASNDGVTDASFASPRRFTQLRELDLNGTSISDVSISQIASIATLQFVDIRNTFVSHDGFMILGTKRPDIKIQWSPVPPENSIRAER